MKIADLPPKKAGDRVCQAIEEMTAQYQVFPGQNTTHALLAKKLKMSETPVINALSRLEQEGFIVSLPQRGFFCKRD